jgi:hypothetical protein
VPEAAVTVAVIVTGWLRAALVGLSERLVAVEMIAADAGSANQAATAVVASKVRTKTGRRPVMRVAAGITWPQR